MMTDKRERNAETGQYVPKVSDDEILEAVHEHEPAGTTEVGDAVGLARQNADYRLRKLAEEDRVTKKMVGNSLVWFVDE
jgi:predicted transcriptional regulator